MSMYNCPYCDEWMGFEEQHRPCPALVARVEGLAGTARDQTKLVRKMIDERSGLRERLADVESAVGTHLERNGPCGDGDIESPYCDDDGCSYCRLIRLCDSPGQGGEVEKYGV